jgi:hypothetical protein
MTVHGDQPLAVPGENPTTAYGELLMAVVTP